MPERGEFITSKEQRNQAVREAELIISGQIPLQMTGRDNPQPTFFDKLNRIIIEKGYLIL